MIGDVPQGAPLRCRLRRHVGQENGGTMCFTCSRCGGTYWQPRDHRALTALGDAMIARGEGDAALRMVREELGGNDAG